MNYKNLPHYAYPVSNWEVLLEIVLEVYLSQQSSKRTEIRIDNEQFWEILIIEQAGIRINYFLWVTIFVQIENLRRALK